MRPLMKSRGLHIGIPGLRLGRGEFASVTQIDANSVAERAGFELDDVITAINDVPVATAARFYALLQHMEPGRSIAVSVDFRKPIQTTVDNVVYFETNYGDDSCGQ
jgi:S1-C subfamily serine protease